MTTKIAFNQIDGMGGSVKDNGAVGDGATDDSTEIAAANTILGGITAGGYVGELEFPFSKGEVYAIEATLVQDKGRTRWVGKGQPDRRTAAGQDVNAINWTGAAGGTMVSINNPLDNSMANLGFNGQETADFGFVQAGTAGWGGCTFDNVVIEYCVQNLLKLTGLVDGGRNVWNRSTFRKQITPTIGTESQDALINYESTNNVEDRYQNCEFIHSISGSAPAGSVGFYVSTGSPDIYLDGGFIKAETGLIQSNDGSGVAYFSINGVYVEGENFFRMDKSGDQRQDFFNVRHVGTGGKSISMLGNLAGNPSLHVGCDYRGDIEVTGRDDFALILIGTEYNSLTLDQTAGTTTNLLQVGRGGSTAQSNMMINGHGVAVAMPFIDTATTLFANLANGSIFRAQRAAGETATVNAPSNIAPVTALDTGTDDTSTAAAFLTDSTASWTIDEFKGKILVNGTDGSTGTILSNTATTITAKMRGGSNDDWDSGDTYTINSPSLDIGREIEIWFEHTSAGAVANITWNAAYKGNTLPTTFAANTMNIFTFRYDGNFWYNTSAVTGITY